MNPQSAPPSAPDSQLVVSEVFGPTIQGEGPGAGQRAVFLRLAGCNVGCTWCDTSYSWHPPDYGSRRPRRLTIPNILTDVLDRSSRASDVVVVTGGEPLAQSVNLLQLVTALKCARPRIHLETAGVYTPMPELVESFETIVVSPKLRNAGGVASQRFNPSAIECFASLTTTWFKFVVTCLDDLDEIAALELQYQIPRIMVMAEGSEITSSLALTRRIANEAVLRGWSVSPRLHIWLWANAPGR